MMNKIVYLFALVLLCVACNSKKTTLKVSSEMKEELTMIVGTYTSGSSKGLYTFRFNQETGEATPLGEAEISNPSYLTLSSDNRYVYAVSEDDGGDESVTSFQFDAAEGTLKKINTRQAMGEAPCYIITNDKYVVTANYSGGSISVFPVGEDGSLFPANDVIAFSGSGADKDRQDAPHLHCVRFTPDGKYLFANDLGTDRIYKFNVNPQANPRKEERLLSVGNPASFGVKPGSGPRHLTFSPDGKYAYLITELAGTVIAFEYNDGMLNEIQTVKADTVGAQGSADIHISPDGNFLYASNRLDADGLAIFKINKDNGQLTKAGYELTGDHPRNFIITPNGKFVLVASRDNNAVEVYQRNAETGMITNINKNINLDKPVCLKFAY